MTSTATVDSVRGTRRRRIRRRLGLLGAATVVVLAWPGPAGADTALGGYSALASATPIHVEIFEPTIPIPSSPQIDGSIGYTRSNTDTGPFSRALSSYLWPGDVIGDGFNQLVGNDNANYPVQVNSRFPATADSPAKNTAQLTDGNGMTTSSNDVATRANVTGLGIAGPGVDLLGGLGKGLSGLAGGKTPTTKAPPKLPLPVSATLAALVTASGLSSESDVVLGKNTITSTAHAHLGQLKLLGGLITMGSIDLTSQTVSDGKTATTTGHVTIGDLKIAGVEIGLDQKGFELGRSAVKAPPLPSAVSSLLGKLGIEFKYLTTKRTVSAATGSLSSQGLQLSIDTAPLKNALNLPALLGPLQNAIEKIPNLGGQLGPLLGIGPKIVLILGDVSTSATAAPAYVGPTTGGGTGGGTNPGTTSGGGTGGGTNPATTGGGAVTTGGGGLGTTGAGGAPSSSGPVATNNGGGTPSMPVASTGFSLPKLGTVPKMLILGAVLFALGIGWALRTAGALLLGASGKCVYGLPSGVPDLREG